MTVDRDAYILSIYMQMVKHILDMAPDGVSWEDDKGETPVTLGKSVSQSVSLHSSPGGMEWTCRMERI
jgi:hypothetical protein